VEDYAMQDSSTGPTSVLQFRQDLQTKLRAGVRRAIETVLEEELLTPLGADAHERTARRRGYRHGTIERTVTTREGTRALTVPRGRVRGATDRPVEFHSRVLPRYARRTREVDEAVLGCYVGGVNSRRIRRALKPLVGEAPLSKSAVSRVVARVKEQFLTWLQRPLAEERYAILFLDGFHLRIRLAGRVITVPVLAALGVTETGQKQLVALQLATTEATTSWGGLLGELQRRGLPAPLLVVTDGHAGLKKALDAWPAVRVQRCTTHKGRNLDDACPVHARPELRRDYHGIIFAADGLAARAAYDAFVKKWTALCPPVARSLEEAGLDLLTFYSFPKAMWKSLRTTNALENLNREFRRRTKTQASFSTEASALTVLFGLVAVGQIVFRKVDGHRELAAFLVKEQWSQAA
jgi:transposase-like protein